MVGTEHDDGWLRDPEVDPRLDHELRNIGPGPARLSLADAAADVDGLALFLHRDYRCGYCHDQVQAVGEHVDAFRERGVAPVSVVPEPPDRVADWVDRFEPGYPLLADPGAAVGDDYGQGSRWGPIGALSDLLGRLPAVVLIDARPEAPRVTHAHRGSAPDDRPSVEAVLAAVRNQQASFYFDCELVDC